MPHLNGTDDGIGYGVLADNPKADGPGLWGISGQGATVFPPPPLPVAGVFGINYDPKGSGVYAENTENGPGLFAKSATGEGVHAESSSTAAAAMAGIALNAQGTGAGVFGTSNGNGAGIWGSAQNGEGVHGETNSAIFAAVAGIALNAQGTGAGVYGASNGNGAGIWGSAQNAEGVHGETNSAIFAAVAGIALNAQGTGAGVYGESRGQGPAGYFNGNVTVTGNLTTNGDIYLPGADCAEEFDTAGSQVGEPGTVMVITEKGALEPSTAPYDKKVAGIVSGAGPFSPGIVLDKQHSERSRAAVALVGKVYCKVDAQYSSIEVGDLLTSSPTPGYAMKADDPQRAFGAVIGKALRRLAAGQGLIPILVALQ